MRPKHWNAFTQMVFLIIILALKTSLKHQKIKFLSKTHRQNDFYHIQVCVNGFWYPSVRIIRFPINDSKWPGLHLISYTSGLHGQLVMWQGCPPDSTGGDNWWFSSIQLVEPADPFWSLMPCLVCIALGISPKRPNAANCSIS